MSQRKGQAEGSDREFERQREEKGRDLSLLTSPTFLCEQKEILVLQGREEGWQKDRVTFLAQVLRISALLLNTYHRNPVHSVISGTAAHTI